MEIHKPKPVHSWRELLTEIGVVVIGVCIALSAEQAVEWVHWRNQVAEAREVISTELANNLVNAIARVRTQNCAERRLDALALTLDAAARSGTLPPVGYISMPIRNIWPSGAWSSVVASQTATHFPRQQLAGLAASYKFLERLQEFNGRELDSWNSLYAMVGPGRRLDAASEAELRKALSHARSDARTIAALSLQMIISVKSHHLIFDREDLERITAAEHQSSLTASICKPIGAVAPSYGQSYSNSFIASLDEAAKKLPDFSEDAR